MIANFLAQAGILLVFLGGGLGAVVRLMISGRLVPYSASLNFPVGILLVNIVGSFLMGLLVALMARYNQGGVASGAAHLFFAVGFLGGLTTFSSFALDAYIMLSRGDHGLSALYVISSVVGSIGALFGGIYLMRMMLAS